MRRLSLDVGSRRVGVAVCDDAEVVVTPIAAIAFHGAAALAREVAALVESRTIGAVVVGLPVTRAGHGRGEARVAAVVAELFACLDVPISTEDERGTTIEAEARLCSADVPPKRRRDLVDSLAAQIILESHLARMQGKFAARTVDPSRDGC